MFNLFKSKPILKDLIPDGHIDIHTHLLPGIDDGARTVEDRLRLTRALQGFGVTEIITTPHVIQHVWDNTPEKIVSIKKHDNTGTAKK
jgi:tyrosine-protein phosphatase YwqE